MPLFPGGAWWPERRVWGIGDVNNGGSPFMQHFHPWGAGSPSWTGYTRVAWLMQAPHAGTLSGFSILLGMLQGEASTWNFSIQSLDANGYPSGSGTPGAPLLGTAWPGHRYHTAMTGSYSVGKGEMFACVAECLSGPVTTVGTFFAAFHPGYTSHPVYSMGYIPSTGVWSTWASGFRPCLVLHYTSSGLDRAPDDCLPMGGQTYNPADPDPPGRMGNLLVTADPVGMRFTVPRPLLCDGFSFNFECTHPVQATLIGGDVSTGGVIPGWPSTTPGNRTMSFERVTLRPGITYEATLTPTTGPLSIHGFPFAPDGEADFEGGPTWQAFGDPIVGWTDRWYFALHIPGPAVVEPGPEPPVEWEPPMAAGSRSRLHLKIVGAYVP